MKRIILYSLGLILLVAAVVYGSIGLYGQLKTGTANAETCKEKGTNHLVTIANGTMSPTHVTGKLCDTMTVKNTDDVMRYIAFGKHDQHQPYDGVSEKTLSKDQEFTITLNELGDYKFHDHLHDETAGTFTVQR